MKDSISSPQQLSDILCVLTLEFSLVWAFWFSAVHDDISEASHGDGEATGWDTTIKMFKASTDDGAWRWRLWTWMRLAKANHRWCWGWMTHISSQHISSSSLFLPPHQNELSSPIPVDLFHQLSSSQHKIGARLYWELSHSSFVLSKVSKWKDSANKLHLYLFAFF